MADDSRQVTASKEHPASHSQQVTAWLAASDSWQSTVAFKLALLPPVLLVLLTNPNIHLASSVSCWLQFLVCPSRQSPGFTLHV
jgi:hypothetical protein